MALKAFTQKSIKEMKNETNITELRRRKGRTPKAVVEMGKALRIHARCELGSVDKLTGDLVTLANNCERFGIYLNVDAIANKMEHDYCGDEIIPTPYWGFSLRLEWNKSRIDGCRFISAIVYRESKWYVYLRSSLRRGVAALFVEVR